MKYSIRLAVIAALITAVFPAPQATAGGHFGLHISNGGFGVTVGIGDWGMYSSSWADPRWSLSFTATLGGYGEWVNVQGLGQVWRPWVAVDWRPYTYGRWVVTGHGWTWVAYEPWGYIPHHYGSWAHCTFGWVWVPGYSYGAANVVWVRSGGYVGWYARPPHGWSHAAHGYTHGYHDGYRDGWRDARYATYVDWRHLGHDNVSHHAVGHAVAARGRGVEQHAAPTALEVRQRAGVTIPQRSLSTRTVVADGREITISRPEGVAPSIERHAAVTASRTLSPVALERRQPTVRARTVSSGTTTSSNATTDRTRVGRSTPEGRNAGQVNTEQRSIAASPSVSPRSSSQSRTAPSETATGTTSGRRRSEPRALSHSTSTATTQVSRPSLRSTTESNSAPRAAPAQSNSSRRNQIRATSTDRSRSSGNRTTATSRGDTTSRRTEKAPSSAESQRPSARRPKDDEKEKPRRRRR